MTAHNSATKNDQRLREAFECLSARGISSDWTNSTRPYSALREECKRLMEDAAFAKELADFLRTRTILRRAITVFYNTISMSKRADWRAGPPESWGLAARGWFIGNWLPIFLIIDGPIGRFLCHRTSPLHSYLDGRYPLLAAARAFIGDKLFLQVRNGFAHWGFDWDVVGDDSYLVVYNWEQDLPIARLHQREADAFGRAAFDLVYILDEVFISQRAEDDGDGKGDADHYKIKIL